MSHPDFDPTYVFSHHASTPEKLAHYDAIHEARAALRGGHPGAHAALVRSGDGAAPAAREHHDGERRDRARGAPHEVTPPRRSSPTCRLRDGCASSTLSASTMRARAVAVALSSFFLGCSSSSSPDRAPTDAGPHRSAARRTPARRTRGGEHPRGVRVRRRIARFRRRRARRPPTGRRSRSTRSSSS